MTAWSQVELREIRAFLALAEELHFGRTAERLDVTSSRVSQTIRQFETRVGRRLFDRTSRSVALTPFGEELLAALKPRYDALEDAFTATVWASGQVDDRLRVGVYTPANTGRLFGEIVTAFEFRWRSCRVELVDVGTDADLVGVLRSGDADVLATRLPFNDPRVVVGSRLSRESRIVIVSNDHPLAEHDSISWEDVGSYDVPDAPALPRELMDSLMPPRTPSGRLITKVPVSSWNELYMRVANGEMVHATVPSSLDHYQQPGTTAVPINDLPESETALVWLRGADKLRTILEFDDVAAGILATHHLDARQAPSSSD